jgi:hypothetical protein
MFLTGMHSIRVITKRRGRERMVGGFTTIPMQSVPIITDVVSSNLDQS